MRRRRGQQEAKGRLFLERDGFVALWRWLKQAGEIVAEPPEADAKESENGDYMQSGILVIKRLSARRQVMCETELKLSP